MDPAYRSLDSKTTPLYHSNEQRLNFSKYSFRHAPAILSGALTGAVITFHAQPHFLKRFGVTGALCLPFGAIYGAAFFYMANFQLQGGWQSQLSMEKRRQVNKGLFGKQQL